MIKANRDGHEMQFEDERELLVFMVENMAMKAELKDVEEKLTERITGEVNVIKADLTEVKNDLAGVKNDITGIRSDLAKLNHDLRDHIDKKTEEVKIHTATLLKNKEIINKEEALQYIRGDI